MTNNQDQDSTRDQDSTKGQDRTRDHNSAEDPENNRDHNSDKGQDQGFINRLKKRWGIHSTFQVIIILVVFACTGFSTLFVEDQLFRLLDLPNEISWYMSVLFFIIITMPVYNIILLVYGAIFGQFRFFWNFEKRFFSFILRIKR